MYGWQVRIALVSPYSWTYPGGVTRHIEALAGELLAHGHDARILTPVDRDTRAVARLHGGARPAPRELPEHVIPLGGTVGLPMNGAVSNLALTPSAVARAAPRAAHRRLRRRPRPLARRAGHRLGRGR